MKTSFKIAEISGITINLHVTFLLLLGFLALTNPKYLFILISLFFFVTIHELAHSLVAKKFGIGVKEITLFPIGGMASMRQMPEKPYQEFFISIAGPLTNVAVIVIFYFPLRWTMGAEVLSNALRSFYSQSPEFAGAHISIVGQIYWLNLVLAGFNLLPAFPMDGGRILRSILAGRMGFQRATKIAVTFGHAFAILFALYGFLNNNILLIFIAFFIYTVASSEEMQVDIKTVLQQFKVKDILSPQYLTLDRDAVLSRVLELMFQSHQEDFPVVDRNSGDMTGFISRHEITDGIRKFGVSGKVQAVMRTDVPSVNELNALDRVQVLMQSIGVKALPVTRNRRLIGVITSDDIGRVYSMMAKKQ